MKPWLERLLYVGVTLIVAVGGTWIWRDTYWKGEIKSAVADTARAVEDRLVGPFRFKIDSLESRLTETLTRWDNDKQALRQSASRLAEYAAMLEAAAESPDTAIELEIMTAKADTVLTHFEWVTIDSVTYGVEYTDTLRITYFFPPVDRFADIYIGIQPRHIGVEKTTISKLVPFPVYRTAWYREILSAAGVGLMVYGIVEESWIPAAIGGGFITVRIILGNEDNATVYSLAPQPDP
jgi:hypothetical protein